jgi:hypothetical protein
MICLNNLTIRIVFYDDNPRNFNLPAFSIQAFNKKGMSNKEKRKGSKMSESTAWIEKETPSQFESFVSL